MALTHPSHRILGELSFFLSLVVISEICRRIAERRFPEHPVVRWLLICTLVLGWYSTSITLVLFNKWILSEWMGNGLAFPIFYTMTHMLFKGVFSVLYLVCMQCKPLPKHSWKVIRTASFIGVLVGLDVAASNLSFQYISVTFYVMVKASALIWILVFAVLAKLEPCSPQIVITIFVISIGIFLSMYGEADFNTTGFGLVLASEIFAAARWVGTQALMSEGEVDSVTAVLYMSPGSALSLLPLVILRERGDVSYLMSDKSLEREYAGIVLLPSFLAFLLLIIEVKLVKETSSLTLSVFGNLKSIATILFAIVVFRESASPVQWCGVTIGTTGMLGYSYIKNSTKVDEPSMEDEHPKYEVIDHPKSTGKKSPGPRKDSEELPWSPFPSWLC